MIICINGRLIVKCMSMARVEALNGILPHKKSESEHREAFIRNAREKSKRNLAMALKRDITTRVFSTDFQPIPALWHEEYELQNGESVRAPVTVAPTAKVDAVQMVSDVRLSEMIEFTYGTESEVEELARIKKRLKPKRTKSDKIQPFEKAPLAADEIKERVKVTGYRWKEIPEFSSEEEEIVLANLDIVIARALRAREDLFTENKGLIIQWDGDSRIIAEQALFKAIDYFDWRSGNHISTLLDLFIIQAMSAARSMEMPKGILKIDYELGRAKSRLEQQGKIVTSGALFAEAGISPGRREWYELYNRYLASPVRLDSQKSRGGEFMPSLIDAIPDRGPTPEEQVLFTQDQDGVFSFTNNALDDLVSDLSREQQLILLGTFVQGKRPKEIAGDLGISGWQVSSILRKTIVELRGKMDAGS